MRSRHLILLALASLMVTIAACTKPQPNTSKPDVGANAPVSGSPDAKAAGAVRESYTPSSVVTELSKDHVAFQFMPPAEFSDALEQLRHFEKKAEADGNEAATPIPVALSNSFSLDWVRKVLGKEDRITEDELPGVVLFGGPSQKKIKNGKYLWYGRVGLGFLDTDGAHLTYVLAVRFAPKKNQ
jgi:hypothetical protein